MKTIELVKIEHSKKIGQDCLDYEPNVTEDCIFTENNVPIGFYIKNMGDYSDKANIYAEIANRELRSSNVPKTDMERASGVTQFSTIIGGVPAKYHLRRPYNSMSSVHLVKTAQTFKAMYCLALEAEKIIENIMPEQYADIREVFQDVPEKWRFGNIFTSSISNFNIPANFHIDKANIKGTVNAIITKRAKSTGGNLHIPDYDATIDQCDNSLLVYPAWKSMHGVTPIKALSEDGYRNSLVFYPLKAFLENKE
jgi:hypothetical protein